MKTTVSNYIYDKYNERGMKTFERKLYKLLKDNDVKGEFIALNAYMRPAQDRGQYERCAELSIDGQVITLRENTNDSQSWDAWENPTTKDKRKLFLAVVENNIGSL